MSGKVSRADKARTLSSGEQAWRRRLRPRGDRVECNPNPESGGLTAASVHYRRRILDDLPGDGIRRWFWLGEEVSESEWQRRWAERINNTRI